jgi:hypothetical protein
MMRAVTPRRPPADIAEDIVFELRPLRRLKRGEVRPEPASAIAQHIEIINRAVADWARIGAVGVIRKRAARAVRALAALEEVCPTPAAGCRQLFFGVDLQRVREQIELLMPKTKKKPKQIEGPDPRANNLHWLCAHQAIVLIEQFSRKPPVTTAGGNTHLVAKLLFEAVTGKPTSDSGLVKALKKVKKWRGGIVSDAISRESHNGDARHQSPLEIKRE